MAVVSGPFRVTVDIDGTHTAEVIAMLIVKLGTVLDRELGSGTYSIAVDWDTDN
jgi:hypothetical protein